jgi:hypothetical protein
MTKLIKGSLRDEQWREYEFGGRIYRIDRPRSVYFHKTGTTHRVVDSKGIVHCVPAPGQHGCVLRWKNKPSAKTPVQW